MKAEAVSEADETFGKGIKWDILVKRSTMTRIQVKPLEEGRSVMKSIDIEDHGGEGISNGCKNRRVTFRKVVCH